ncbi:MAG: secretin N-terminal domain-containing protein [Candidatus Omnitrophica bacterium]|nr:secretin N-terminal domain-containing protein [Candidatus Omnitrophota bacterium]
MSRAIKLNVFIFIAGLFFMLPRLNADPKVTIMDLEPVVSMDFQDANLKDVLKVLSIQSGLNFIASESVQDRKVTLYLDKVPVKEAMDKLFKANNLTYDINKESNIFIVKDWGKPQLETVTRVFYLKYATVSSSSLKEEMGTALKPPEDSSGGSSGPTPSSSSSSGGGSSSSSEGKWKAEEDVGITNVIKKLLTPAGSVIEDFRTNSLIITDSPRQMEVIAGVIASLDTQSPQVMLEVEMLDVSKNVVDKLGFDWTNAGSFAMQIVSASRSLPFPISGFKPDTASKTFTPGTLSFPTNLKFVFDYLTTQTDTKFLARPRILTLNNEPAEIKIASNESIGVKTTTAAAGGSSGTTTSEAERALTGVILRVIPQINVEAGEITMFINPKVSEAIQGNTLTSDGKTNQFRDPEERSSKSLIRIKDGETVIIGGLLRNEFSQVTTKVPFLGDIPILGAVFRHKGGTSDKNKQRELLIFITPHIRKDVITSSSVQLAQAPKQSLPAREQDVALGFNRDLAINSSLRNFEKK